MTGLFSEWMKREQGTEDPVGLEAAKQRILAEKEVVPRIFTRRGTNPQIKGQEDLNQTIKGIQAAQPTQTKPEQPKTPAPRTNVGDGDFAKSLQYLRDNHNLEGVGSFFDKNERGTGKGAPSAYVTSRLSGLDYAEDFPMLPGRLSGITDLARKYISEENGNNYNLRAQASVGDNASIPVLDDYYGEENVNRLKGLDISDLPKFLNDLGDRNQAFAQEQHLAPQERAALLKNFPDEASTLGKAPMTRAIRNRDITLEQIADRWEEIPKSIRDVFEGMGHSRGSHSYWKTPEGRTEWGQNMALRYAQQMGQDAYLNFEDGPVIHPADMVADHQVAKTDKSWIEKAKEQNPDVTDPAELEDLAYRMADDPENMLLTRYGFNQGPKKSASLWDVVQKQKKLLGDGAKNKDLEKKLRVAAGDLRRSEYIDPMRSLIKELAKDGLSQEEYDMIRDLADVGYSRLAQQYPRDHAGGRSSSYERSVLTDPFRILMNNISMGKGMGVDILAEDRFRASPTGQPSGWQGIDGTHPNSGDHKHMRSLLHTDPALDFLKDRLGQAFYLHGDKGKSASRDIMRRIKRAGDAMVTGTLGTKQFVNYIKDNLASLSELTGIDSPFDIESSSKEYLKALNNTAQKVKHEQDTGSKKGFKHNPETAESDLRINPRPAMANDIMNKALYDDFDSLHQDLKSILTDEPWDEIYKDSILEDGDIDPQTFLGYNINTKLL